MSASWHFREFRPGDNASDPDFTKALFSRGGENALAHSIVRESIQNSLDARHAKTDCVRVTFCVRTGRMAASAASAVRFLNGAWEHLAAPNSGLANPPDPSGTIPFLTVEDFGTTGLVGDTAQWQPFGSERNPFFLFFRALGRSGKEGEERGRWGVGKFVFPLASAGSCWFGYTVPSSAKGPTLMGRIVLKTHGTAQKSFHPDGHWGLRTGDSTLVMPETDARVLADFRALFSMKRREESGLSVVVPWLSDEVTGDALAEAAISEYFLPILRGELVVQLDHNGNTKTIDATTLSEGFDDIEDPNIRARVQLAVAMTKEDGIRPVELQHRVRFSDAEWPKAALTDETAKKLLEMLDSGKALGVRVPIEIKPKDSRPISTFFDVYLLRAEATGREKPLIVRQGITITEEKTRTLQDIASLVIVDDYALAKLVGNAESPAHTELQYQLIKDQYTYAGKILQLLRSASANVVRELEHSSRDDDPFALAQYFPVLTEQASSPAKSHKSKDKPGGGPEPLPDPPDPKPQLVRVSRIERGFKVSGSGDPAQIPEEVVIRFAYDVRRGNPFKRYQPLDFSAKDGDLTVATDAVDSLITEDNRISFHPIAETFECAVTGFDPNRNVIVKVNAE